MICLRRRECSGIDSSLHESIRTRDLESIKATSLEAARAARSPVVLLLAAVLFLNYVDRGAFPTAAHLIQKDLPLSGSQLGILMSAFFWSYAALQIPIGWLAERYGAQRVLAAGLTLWALATLLVG